MTAGKNWIRKFVFALAFFNSGLAIVVAQPGLGTGFKPPQQLDGSQSTGEKQPPTASDQLGPQANRPNTQFDNLLRELNSLIPGGVNSSPERKKALEEAVTAFQLKNGQRVIEIFDGQRQKELDFPPNELLLAGLSFAAEDLKTGRVLLERSALLSPDHPSTYAAFARLAINQGRLTDALAMLEKTSRVIEASQISPEYVKFYRQAYLDSMTDLAMRQQRYDDARKYLELQRVDLPQNPKVLMVSAELEFKQKNVDQALAYLNELRKVQPSTRRAETVIALWFERVGDKPRAEKWIKTAAEKYPNDEKVQLAFANWALGQGELPVASEAIARAEKKEGESAVSKNLKARIAFSRQSYGVAEAHYQSLLESQRNFDASNMYVLCLIESQDEEKRNKAKGLAVQNVRALPNNLIAQATMGYVHLKLGELEQAKSTLAAVAKTRGRSPEIDYFLACLLKEMNQLEEARKTVESALNFKGFFLYRTAAQRLETSMASAELPAPGQTNSK